MPLDGPAISRPAWTFIQGIPKAERIISAIRPWLLLKLLGSGPLESVSPFPAADSVRSLWMESGIGLPIYTLSDKPMPLFRVPTPSALNLGTGTPKALTLQKSQLHGVLPFPWWSHPNR